MIKVKEEKFQVIQFIRELILYIDKVLNCYRSGRKLEYAM